LIERASILADGNEILPEHLSFNATQLKVKVARSLGTEAGTEAGPRAAVPCVEPIPVPEASPPCFSIDRVISLEALEAQYLAWAEKEFQGDRSALAQQLGISPRTLFRKLNQYLSPGTGI
jgi:DNA-binding NtrC family response regulator